LLELLEKVAQAPRQILFDLELGHALQVASRFHSGDAAAPYSLLLNRLIVAHVFSVHNRTSYANNTRTARFVPMKNAPFDSLGRQSKI